MSDYSNKDPFANVVRALQAGEDPDRDKLKEILRSVHAFICSNYPTLRQDAKDLTQTTAVRMCKNIDTFRWDSQFLTWVIAIAKNVVREYCRRPDNQVIVGQPELLEKDTVYDPDDQVLKNVLYDEAVNSLDDEERLAIRLRFTDDGLTSFRDVGDAMGIESIKAQRLVYRALPKLAQYWKEHGW